ncbi:toll/interleukin-1 receptor domain-containing protein [Bradyrhizobium sp. AT1]|uniref:toll/interleukin-1 receptor domain-containing protein n=1 Tax=Bradyrhizobium sp. AT1 TaxID=574934 RepID=UPI0007ABF712|nr:toll/interleukin-1 receptor domain-containing protein [Bradyrhizobium sp. AT1]
MYHVFISYAQKNGEIAASLASQLDDLGLRVFLAERNLNAGENWEPTIRSALKNSKLVLCLITPESKTSGWVHAEAGAAWVLEKPLLPVFRHVDPRELIDILRMPLGRRIETSAQIGILLDDICKMFSVSRCERSNGSQQSEEFTSPMGWQNLLKIGRWYRRDEDEALIGGGMHNYVLSHGHYSRGISIDAVLRFMDLAPVNRLDAVNAGIVFGWATPRGVRRYFNLLLNQERMFLELIGDRGGDAYLDFKHLDDGIQFSMEEGVTYSISITIADRRLATRVVGPYDQWSYSVALPEDPLGRVGLRPWRSRIECEKFEVRGL